MALPTTGPISLGQIQTEFGGSIPISLSEYYYNGTHVKTTNNGKIPSSGINKFSNYRGAQDLLLIEYLVVGGGGGGGGGHNSDRGGGGGGGAGGYISGSVVTLTTGVYDVIVGDGGAGATAISANGSKGSNSSFNSIVATGGGYGGGWLKVGGSGGSGGGGGGQAAKGSGTTGRGNNGGSGGSGNATGGGGGGAGAVGSSPGNGGIGKQWLNGTYYAGGGAGSTYFSSTAGTGGTGGGGSVNSPGTANTGGGGSADAIKTGNAGGSGIVIIRYPGTTTQAAGGAITFSGGYVYHKFTSSDNLYWNGIIPTKGTPTGKLFISGHSGYPNSDFVYNSNSVSSEYNVNTLDSGRIADLFGGKVPKSIYIKSVGNEMKCWVRGSANGEVQQDLIQYGSNQSTAQGRPPVYALVKLNSSGDCYFKVQRTETDGESSSRTEGVTVTILAAFF